MHTPEAEKNKKLHHAVHEKVFMDPVSVIRDVTETILTTTLME